MNNCNECPIKNCMLVVTIAISSELLKYCPCGKCLVNLLCEEVCEERVNFTKIIFTSYQSKETNAKI
jgi:hypothetical protein